MKKQKKLTSTELADLSFDRREIVQKVLDYSIDIYDNKSLKNRAYILVGGTFQGGLSAKLEDFITDEALDQYEGLNIDVVNVKSNNGNLEINYDIATDEINTKYFEVRFIYDKSFSVKKVILFSEESVSITEWTAEGQDND